MPTAIKPATCAACGNPYTVRCYSCDPAQGSQPAPDRTVPVRPHRLPAGHSPHARAKNIGDAALSMAAPAESMHRDARRGEWHDPLDCLVVGDPFNGADEVRLTQPRLRVDALDADNECEHGWMPYEPCVECGRKLRFGQITPASAPQRYDRPRPVVDPHRVRELYEAGRSLVEVAGEVGVSVTLVRKQLLAQGVRMRPSGFSRTTGPTREAA